MKIFLARLCIVCMVTLMLSAPAFASLWSGTWDQTTTDQIQLGTWSESGVGTSPPGFTGAVSTETANNLPVPQWTANTVRSNSIYSAPVWDGHYYEMNFNTPYTQWAYHCIFFDGNSYVANLSGGATYTLYFTALGAYNHCSTIIFQGNASMVYTDPTLNPTYFSASYYATGDMTYNNYNSGTYTCGGDITSAALTLTALPTPVPIPGAIWMLGSGLLGLIGIRRRIRS